MKNSFLPKLLFGAAILFLPLHLAAMPMLYFSSEGDHPDYSQDEILIRFHSNFSFKDNPFFHTGNSSFDSLISVLSIKQVIRLLPQSIGTPPLPKTSQLDDIFLLRFAVPQNIKNLIDLFNAQEIVDLAEPNYFYFWEASAVPIASASDFFQWRQATPNQPGANPVILAIIDAGFDKQKKTLHNFLQRNPLPKTNNQDDNRNGYLDDVSASDFLRLDLPPELAESSKRKQGNFLLSEKISAIVSYFCNQNQKIQFIQLNAARQSSNNFIIFDAFSVSRAIIYAADNHARLINFSGWGTFPSEILRTAINYAKNKDCTLIAPAGDNINQPVFPAAFDDVLAVTALDSNEVKIEGANCGEWVKVAAPGFLPQALRDTNFHELSPTVFAAACVSGLASLLLTYEGEMSSDSLVKRIIFSSENVYDKNPHFSGWLGAGRINVFRTLSGQQKPNIIIQPVLSQNTNQSNKNDTLAFYFSLKNLSYPAKKISVKLASPNQSIQFIKKEFFLDRLNFQAEFNNKNNPFKIYLNSDATSNQNLPIKINITAANEFSLSKAISLSLHHNPPRNFHLLANNPATLTWSTRDDVAGFNLYRRESKEPAFAKINKKPITDFKFIDHSIQSNLKYFYYLTALDSAGVESMPSAMDSVWLELCPTFHFAPAADSLILSDSILFHVQIKNLPDTTVNIYWRINGSLVQTDSLSFVLKKYSLLLNGKDTLQLSLFDDEHDTVAVKTWFIKQNGSLPQKVAFSFFPPGDTSILVGDTARFFCYWKNDSAEAIDFHFHWLLNDSLIRSGKDSTFFYLPLFAFSKFDTVQVQITTTDTSLFHRWIITVQPAKDFAFERLIFSPDSAVTISCGDTLLMKVEPFSENLIYHWFRNGLRDSSAATNFYFFCAPLDSGGRAEISATVFSVDSIQRITNNWRITYRQEVSAFDVMKFFPTADTTIFEGDTLILGIQNFLGKQPPFKFFWKKNGLLDSTVSSSSYLFMPNFAAAGIDTMTISFLFNDSLVEHDWNIQILNKNRLPNIISALPPVDSILTKTDSLFFKIYCVDADGDSLIYRWLKNNSLISTATDSFYYYTLPRLDAQIADTVTVQVWDQDSMTFAQWIIFPSAQNSPPAIESLPIIFSPDSAKVIFLNDSLFFSVTNIPDSSVVQWFINGKQAFSDIDTLLVFNLDRLKSQSDTILVLISTPDTSISREWQVVYFSLFSKKDRLKMSFFPKDSLITFSERDSLTFSVKAENDRQSDVNVHWFVNHKLQENFADTIFQFLPQAASEVVDTVTVLITHADTTIFFHWALRFEKRQFLPPPHLIFPIAGNRISASEKLIWENDSSMMAFDTSSICRYFVQLSVDSNFSHIFSEDTCSACTLPFIHIKGFEEISISEAVYWRVQLIKQNAASDFARSPLPFFYYPTFAVVTSFSGIIREEGILLSWSTAYEANCAGFNIYRKNNSDGSYEKMNDYLITGQHNYYWLDEVTSSEKMLYYKLEEITANGRQHFHQTLAINLPAPTNFSLSQNFPNPFNSTTFFKYQIPKETHVLIEVYNILGKKVKTLVDQKQEAGFYTVYWDGVDEIEENVVSGIYFYIMSTENFHATQKMIVVR